MPVASFALVLVAVVTHAYWNYLLKRHHGGTAFIGLSKIAEVVLFAPVFLIVAVPHARSYVAAWPLVVVGAALTLANYAALGRAYLSGSLSVAYPVSRGGTLLFLPILGCGE